MKETSYHAPDSGFHGIQAHYLLEQALQHRDRRIQAVTQDSAADPDTALPLLDMRLDKPAGRLIVDVAVTGQKREQLLERGQVWLFIKHFNQSQQSNPLTIRVAEEFDDGLRLHLDIPVSFVKTFQREFFRVSLPEDLRIHAELRHANWVLDGYVTDFSAGGCRIRMTPQIALSLLNSTEGAVRLILTFPNRQQVQTAAEIRYLRPNTGFDRLLLGCSFIHQSRDSENRFVRLAQEIERETARRVGGRLQHLRASALFQEDREDEFLKPAARVSQNKPAPLLFSPGLRTELGKLADQLACQSFLLAENQTFDPDYMREGAAQLLELLEQDESGVHFALAQSSMGIHPVLLHLMRVAVRFYPLALQMGLSSRYQVPIMTALLVHDLSKLFVGYQHACMNPRKQPSDLLRQLKIHQLQVLRAASSLQWVPKDINESLLVNCNERLDGSGFPRGLTGEQLDPLARGIALVKVLDCLVSATDTPAMRWTDAYLWVLRHQQQFDSEMLKSYVRRFGRLPVGARIRFESGCLAWVSRTGHQGEIEEIILISRPDSTGDDYGERISGQALTALGKPQEVPPTG